MDLGPAALGVSVLGLVITVLASARSTAKLSGEDHAALSQNTDDAKAHRAELAELNKLIAGQKVINDQQLRFNERLDARLAEVERGQNKMQGRQDAEDKRRQ